MNKVLDAITKTREYLDYIEEHYNYVQDAWELVQEKCSDLYFIKDDFNFKVIDGMIKDHDFSKLSSAELVPYRRKFYPTQSEIIACEYHENHQSDVDAGFAAAWEHHQKHNNHHWQYWVGLNDDVEARWCVVGMVCDWIAMSMKFGDTAKEYYEKHADEMNLPEWAITFMYKMFDRVYGTDE